MALSQAGLKSRFTRELRSSRNSEPEYKSPLTQPGFWLDSACLSGCASVLEAPRRFDAARFGQRRTNAPAPRRRRAPLGRRISGHSSRRPTDRAGRRRQSHPGVELLLGTTVTDLRHGCDAISVGLQRVVRPARDEADLLIGADGLRSQVRHGLGFGAGSGRVHRTRRLSRPFQCRGRRFSMGAKRNCSAPGT